LTRPSAELIPANMIGRSLDDGDLLKLRMLVKKKAGCAIGATADAKLSAGLVNHDPRCENREDRNEWKGVEIEGLAQAQLAHFAVRSTKSSQFLGAVW
jgi:hypothetical protein